MSCWEPDVTAAHRPDGSPGSRSRVPGKATTSSRSASSSCSSSAAAAACSVSGTKSETVSSVRRPWHTLRISAMFTLRRDAQVLQVRSTAGVESTRVPSMSNRTASTSRRMGARYNPSSVPPRPVRLLTNGIRSMPRYARYEGASPAASRASQSIRPGPTGSLEHAQCDVPRRIPALDEECFNLDRAGGDEPPPLDDLTSNERRVE
jgi:hypothetical protein